MNIYNFLEKPRVYNFVEKILSLGNRSCERCLLDLVQANEENLILDVGCGTARYAKLFKGRYHGTDINPDYIKFAAQNYPGIFAVMDAANLQDPDGKFDFVFNVGIFHHMEDETVKEVAREMKRVCKDGGKVFAIEAVYPPKLNFPGYLLFKFDRGKHTRTFNQLKNLLESEGYQLIKGSIDGSYPYRLCVYRYGKT